MDVVSGDPNKTGGLYVIRIRKLIDLKPGAHALMPAKMPHFGLHRAGNVVEVYGEGPFVVNFVNPEDDPNRAGKK